MLDDFLDSGCFAFLTVVLLIALIVAGFAVSIDQYTEWTCENYSEMSGYETHYIHFDQCYMKKEDGKWYTWTEHTAEIVAKEGLQNQ